MKLYYMTGACSLVSHIALEWTKQVYEAESMPREKLKSPEFLALNPIGSVPCLVDGDFVLTQSVAILSYLNNIYPDAQLFGANNPKSQANTMRWLAFCNSDLHKAFGAIYAPQRLTDDETAFDKLREKARQNILSMLGIANLAINQQGLFGEQKTVADAYLFVILTWCKKLEIDFSHLQNINALFNTMSKDLGVQAAMKAEGL